MKCGNVNRLYYILSFSLSLTDERVFVNDRHKAIMSRRYSIQYVSERRFKRAVGDRFIGKLKLSYMEFTSETLAVIVQLLSNTILATSSVEVAQVQ